MLIGKRINERYKILELIGGGGMSHVYLAEDMILNREVAIKVLRYDFSNEEELHRRFQREALAATSLAHPNIVSIYDVGNDGNYHFIVMEYIEGKTLKQYIQQFSPISPAKAVQIMKQLTSAIEHAHDHQIIHRDIKPQNILVDQNGNVKITDFGIATTLSATSYTKTNSVIGTVHYLSPEQARGGIASHKSDIYALGIVLFELLTGELPFSGESAVSIALKHLQSETPSVKLYNPAVPQSLENVVLKATAKDPKHRYTNVAEMAMDIETSLLQSRSNEVKYSIPVEEDEATRVMPVIKDPPKVAEKAPIDVEKIEPVKQQLPSKKKKPILPFMIGGIVLAAVIGFVLFIMLKPSKIEVPDVRDMTIEQATEAIEEAGLKIGDITERHDEEIELGKVIETTPKASVLRVKGSEIDLIVSLGVESTEMVSYVGSQIDQILPMLSKMFKEVVVEDVYSDQPVGEILEQTPAEGENIVPEETVITFKVSQGKKMATVTDLTNYTQSAIRDYERSSGLKVVVAGEEFHASIPKGSVISQNKKVGETLPEGSTIEVVVSKGQEEKEVKTYVRDLTLVYEPTEEGQEQIIKIYIQDKTHSLVDLYEEIKITKDTPYRMVLEIVEGEKAAYQILRDNVIILQETIPYN